MPERDVTRLPRPVVPVARASVDGRLLHLLADLAAASTSAEIAQAAVREAVELLGGRAGALALVSPGGARVEIVGSVGFDCGAMSTGGALAADAGLPVTRAATSGMTVVEGPWIAAPLLGGLGALGALLVCLPEPTSTPIADAALVEEIAAHARAALVRLPRRIAAPELITAHYEAAGLEVFARMQPAADARGGDVVDLWPDRDGGAWLFMADACGADAQAAATALAVTVAARALTSVVNGPSALLAGLDAALAATAGSDRFVTALAARLDADGDHISAVVASAGHPAPVIVGCDPRAVILNPDAPLNLRLGETPRADETTVILGAGERLLLCTDGVVDRLSGTLSDDVLLAAIEPLADTGGQEFLAALAHRLEQAGGPARDDAALAIVGTLGQSRTSLR